VVKTLDINAILSSRTVTLEVSNSSRPTHLTLVTYRDVDSQ
jgi:hypothetical protein